jgi:hypothetical protein
LALSRITIAALLASSPVPAQAADPLTTKPLTAEQALENYRLMFKPIVPSGCPKGENGEIVVCAKREKQGPPFEPTPGVRPGRVAGEAPRGAVGGFRCLQSCPQPLRVDLIKAPGAIKKGIARILGKD